MGILAFLDQSIIQGNEIIDNDAWLQTYLVFRATYSRRQVLTSMPLHLLTADLWVVSLHSRCHSVPVHPY